MILQTTLTLAAAAAFINLWIFVRCVRVRAKERILHGDGGNTLLIKRMRAHSNFIEHTPIFLVMCGVVEMSTKGGKWLAIVGAVFMVGRVLHVIGMDSDKENLPRGLGMGATLLTEIGLAVVAVLIALGKF
jgi:uncharacterized protein